ncbi:MAG: hypothetical protein LBG48_02615 [Rickettsiales bacterium]|jgi:predicted GH43/DUF377 family glycosyl hydrolase|nr:hypothetical protein [Rickettsiales bacterium]
MAKFSRSKKNPILKPNKKNSWEVKAAFNPSIVFSDNKYHLLYRAISSPRKRQGFELEISSIGYTEGTEFDTFGSHHKLIEPEFYWESFGCEDPRVTRLENKYYIFYTALSTYPFSADGIKVGLAITKDFKKIEEKHLVTPFNSNAMALFPEKINGKFVAILTADTDDPPAKIALAFFEKESDIWNQNMWEEWYSNLTSFVIPLLRNKNDHIEVGAQPIKTEKGWLVIYSYIKNYFSADKVFSIEAVLLDLKNPLKVIGRTKEPLLVPEESYELSGNISNIIFPSSAIVEGNELLVYYGATDTVSCVASCNLAELLEEMVIPEEEGELFFKSRTLECGFERYVGNPIIKPIFESPWEGRSTFNPAAIYLDEKVHILYRAFSYRNKSIVGYASSKDGVHIDERLPEPVYVARKIFEKRAAPDLWCGCEDARLTRIEDTIYITYTAFNGRVPRVALSTISVFDFINKKWNWSEPIAISSPCFDDKNACFLPRKIDGKFVIFHRPENYIGLNFVDDLDGLQHRWLDRSFALIKPRAGKWDNKKIGISAPPIELKEGWLLLYHGVSDPGHIYKVGAILLDLKDPTKVLGRTDVPLMEPEMDYELYGDVPNVVFPCGAVMLKDEIFLYYGGADLVVGVAKMAVKDILKQLS